MRTQREPELIELMDSPQADTEKLRNTYIAFRPINNMLSFWHLIYQKEIKPKLKIDAINSIADVGCGDGYLLHQIGNWAKDDGFNCTLIGIEPDRRALDSVNFNHTIQFIHSTIEDIDECFDIIISNHVLHHLLDSDIRSFLNSIALKTNSLAILNDIKRSSWARLLFPFVGIWFARKSFVLIDGLRSIRRSFSLKELQQLAPSNWKITNPYPFRLVAIYEKNS